MWNRALVMGLRQSGRIRLLLPLYLCLLLLGLVQTWPLGLAGLNGSLRTPLLDTLITGGVDAFADLFIGVPNLAIATGTWVLLAVPILLAFSVAYNFFSGGMLSASAGTYPFWAGCRRTFWSFTMLGGLLVILALVVTIGVSALISALHLGATLSAAILFTLVQVLNLLGEYARAVAVARDRRNPFVLLGGALAFCVRHIGGVLAMLLLGLLIQVAIIALYGFGDQLVGNSLVAIVLQQLCVALWLWAKFVRLLWAMSYIRTADQQMQSAVVEGGLVGVEGLRL